MNFSLSLDFETPCSILFVIFPYAFEGISIAVGGFSVAVHFIIDKLSIVLLIVSGDLHLSPAFFFVLDEVALVDISIAVVDDPVSVEMSILERSLVGFVFQSIGSFAILLVISELPFVDCSAGLNNHSLPVFLTHDEVSSVFGVFVQQSQLSFTVEFIVEELPFVFNLSFETVDTSSVLFSILELACVRGAVVLFESTLKEVVVPKGAMELLSVAVIKLAVISLFLVLTHMTDVLGTV
jgi:hypothetical protein